MAEAAFLTSAWLSELREALQGLVIGEPGSVRLALGQEVTGSARGATSYTITFGGGEPTTVEPGSSSAQVTLVEDYATARQLASGTSASELLSLGKVKLRGDVNALLSAGDTLLALSRTLSDLDIHGRAEKGE